MRLLVVQLSDVHFNEKNNPVLQRATRIIEAVRSLDLALDHCVLALSGDIAFAGRDEEYSIALEFFTGIQQRLANDLRPSVPVSFAVVPGNHDCNYEEASGARDTIIRALLRDESDAFNVEIAELCTTVQRSFFDFRDLLKDRALRPSNRLYYEYKFTGSDGDSVLFRCYNTAWLCRSGNDRGSLRFPLAAIPPDGETGSIVISMFHHPYAWLAQNNDRAFRTFVEQKSDIVLTGHEHVPSRRRQEADTGETSDYIEAGALQEVSDPDSSSFNVLLLDTQQRQQRFIRFAWDGERYLPAARPSDWEDLQLSRLRLRHAFQMTPEFEGLMEDVGVSLTHPDRGRLRLSEIFVYPDLREMKRRQRDVSHSVGGGALFNHLLERENLLITGPEKSGKTSLARTLFKDLLAKGFVPVLLDAANRKLKADARIVDQIVSLADEQYADQAGERYRQLDRSRRVVIIDNSHKMRLASGASGNLIEVLERFAGKVILLANDVAQHLNEIVDASRIMETRKAFSQFRIQQLGYVARAALIEKWFSLSHSQLDEEGMAHRVRHLERTLDTLIGKNFIPSYPIFVLSVLQAHEGATPVDTNASTYGYFYELLVRNALAKGSKQTQFDVKVAYLAFFAFRMYTDARSSLDRTDLLRLHRAYEDEHDVALSFADMLVDLERTDMLLRIGDTFEFKYRYIYYYFVAVYLKDRITEQSVRELVQLLAKQMHVDESANIMLFLVHLSKDPFIIEQMLERASTLYGELSMATLSDDVAFLGAGDLALSEVSYTERDFQEARLARLAELDRANGSRDVDDGAEALKGDGSDLVEEAPVATEVQVEDDDAFGELRRIVSDMGAALKTLQILGQLLKNFPGSLNATMKVRIGKECYGLGLRILAAMLGLLREERVGIVRDIMYYDKSENPEFTNEQLVARAKETLFGLTHGVSYALIRRIAFSVGSPDLERTYSRLRAELGEEPSIALIDTSLRLEQFSAFPRDAVTRLGRDLEGKLLPLTLLRNLVVAHFDLFPVNFAVKQSVCAAIGVSYHKQVRQANPMKRLVGPQS